MIKFKDNITLKNHKEIYQTVENNHYSESFGLQWKKFSKTQFIGYGACATGTVLTRMMNLDNHLSGFIEDNRDKHGYLSPNSFLPVVSLESIKNIDNIIIIILAWRFKDQIIKRIRKKFGKKLRIISVMPNMTKIVEL